MDSRVKRMAQTLTITLPDGVYELLHKRALADNKSVVEVACEALRKATSEQEASPTLEAELCALSQKSDSDLWEIAHRQLPPPKLRRFSTLINKHEAGEQLMPDDLQEMEQLIEEGEQLTTIKSEAYVLLKQRGHQLPIFQEMDKQ